MLIYTAQLHESAHGQSTCTLQVRPNEVGALLSVSAFNHKGAPICQRLDALASQTMSNILLNSSILRLDLFAV